jgi:Uma2 family endonuclease
MIVAVRLASRRWTRLEYDRLVEQGLFRPDEHVELLNGLLVVREPQGSRHAAVVAAVRDALAAAFGPGYHVRDQAPLALDDVSEPEPDLVVVPGRPWNYLREHPSLPLLVVEVSDSTLGHDRRYKAGLYARAGVADYWIVNLVDLVLEVHREPVPSAGARHGFIYRSVKMLVHGESVTPLAAPAARLLVADLLPPA